MNYVDSHSHLADPRLGGRAKELIHKAEGLGIKTFVQGGVDPEDWKRQLALKEKFPEIQLCFGLHPYFVADHTEEECESALDELSRFLPLAVALGELGLDLRPQVMKDSFERQISIFEKQIEMADFAKKTMVLHLVRAHEEALRCFELWGVPSQKGMVHSFNGSVKQAQDFLKLGLFISVGGAVCWEKNHRLHQAIAEIPLEYLLLETDSPDQPPPDVPKEQNEPSTLILVAQKVAEIKKRQTQEILDRCSQNARKLFSI